MSFLNDTSLTPASFILNGIPGLEEVYLWIPFPLCAMHIITITENFGLMYLIYFEEGLHRHMYTFLALLSFTDVLTCTSTLPNTLGILGNVIPHTYCDHMSVAKISCGNIKLNAIYGLTVAFLIPDFDVRCLAISYTMILRAVGHTIPPHIHIIMANLYPLMPPIINPIVYGVKTKQIQENVINFLPKGKNNSSHNIYTESSEKYCPHSRSQRGGRFGPYTKTAHGSVKLCSFQIIHMWPPNLLFLMEFLIWKEYTSHQNELRDLELRAVGISEILEHL
ncbi:hypothetical protein HPG69_005790 [Diceros bicornis minor]|uniref:Uncharacterized protein n=1 Tax=Diceros bicornis minor TaxID=77932 RepID=A0A7J7ESI2_DICBM|nr:hypothetical protein HPG69_005790 [Diceros bicornis minor]